MIMQIMRHRRWGQGFVFLLLLKSGRDLMPASKHKSISSSAQYVTLEKYFSHSSLVIYSIPTPTHKAKTGTANR
jgi:hypothetical protein